MGLGDGVNKDFRNIYTNVMAVLKQVRMGGLREMGVELAENSKWSTSFSQTRGNCGHRGSDRE